MTPDYDSILTATDSNVVTVTEFYKVGATVSSHTVPMQECGDVVADNGYVMVAMAVAFMAIAAILFLNRSALVYRLKDFFTSKRLYVDANAASNTKWKVNVFLLILISVASLSVMFWKEQVEQAGTALSYGLLVCAFFVLLATVYVKAWVYSLVNWVFYDSESSQCWMSIYLLMTATTAFPFYLLTLLDVCAVWSHEIVTGCVIMVVFLYESLLFYKLFINFRTQTDGYLLNILYFCTVELLPTLVANDVLVWVSRSVIVQNFVY